MRDLLQYPEKVKIFVHHKEDDSFQLHPLEFLVWEMETGCTNPGPPNEQDVATVINWRKSGGIPVIKEDGRLALLIKQCLQYDPQRRLTAVKCVDYLTQHQQHTQYPFKI